MNIIVTEKQIGHKNYLVTVICIKNITIYTLTFHNKPYLLDT